ncbi:sialate O-acetylesterase [Agrobacterium tumefaciens]|uniref:Sialate O-acetylesterase domain-containing protein n=1 Tax=Agrobacterium tumefaciens TaxID=358 RepID=A0A176WW71_AGRTU|nr:sialate O-acetylesterase [Agrobacterium tumefaciens]OAE37634.1 hypothetical protein A7J57_08635 [Agrobacterium tumefaciens]
MFIGAPFANPALLGAGAFENPTSISGLMRWYDASDDSTVTRDGSNLVGQWRDKSGSGDHLNQSTAARKPVFTPNSLNGLPGIAFTDTATTSASRMDGTLSTSTTETTIFLVITIGSLVGTFDGILGQGGLGNLYTSTVLDWSPVGTADGTTGVRNIPLPALNKPIVLSMRRSSSVNNAEVRENFAILKKTTHTGGATASTVFRLGYDSNTNQSTITAYEIATYSRYLSDAEMLQMEDYLNNKWACYVNFAGRRSLHRGPQRYATANNITSLSGLPAPKQLYFVFGQSNAAGVAPIADLPAVLKLPITNAKIWTPGTSTFDTLEANVNNQPNSAGQPWHGPELSFMYDLVADFGESYLVKSATGGTDLATRWRPDSPSGQNLYRDFITKIDNARYAVGMATGLELKPNTGIWYQGEADTGTPAYAAAYQANEAFMINTLRNGVDVTGAENLKLVVPSINNTNYDQYYQQINAAKDANAASLPNYYRIPGWVAPNTVDGIHGNSSAEVGVGNAAALIAGATTQVS